MLQVFYLDVAYDSHTCFMCMFQMFHLLQMYVAFKYFMFQRCVQRIIGHGPSAEGSSTVSRVPAVGARGALGSYGRGHAHPHPGSRVIPARREREREEWVAGKEPRTQRQGWSARAGWVRGVRQEWVVRASRHSGASHAAARSWLSSPPHLGCTIDLGPRHPNSNNRLSMSSSRLHRLHRCVLPSSIRRATRPS
jgi:hypothetical protein